MPRSERQSEIFKGAVTFNESITVDGVLNVNTTMNFAAALTGLGLINSGDTTATVSTAAVNSNGGVFVSPVAVAASSPSFIGSGQGVSLGVNSIVANTSFMVVTGGATAVTAQVGFRWWIVS